MATRSKVVLAAFLLLTTGMLPSSDTEATVGLLYFRATAQIDGSILLEWATQSEENISAFRLYRAEGENGVEAYLEGSQQASQLVPVAGFPYFYSDRAVTPGVTYYYRLAEVASGLPNILPDRVSATAQVADTPTLTPTLTPTASLTPTRTRTATRGVSSYAILETATDRPTATRRFTVTPLPPDTVQPAAARPPTQPAALQRVVPTVGLGRVTTPTGQPGPPLPPATATLPLPTIESFASPTAVPSETPTTEPTPSPTPLPTPTSTPQELAQLIIDTLEPSPQPVATVALPDDRSDQVSWLLPVSGGILGFALLAGLVLLATWYLHNRR